MNMCVHLLIFTNIYFIYLKFLKIFKKVIDSLNKNHNNVVGHKIGDIKDKTTAA